MPRALALATAGHVDHGKTTLVRALTGRDTDRLPQERERGISIDLGYAPLELPDGRTLSLIDVPGHERFVRAMVAGATGVDLFLLVIDAAEGARRQTHEHLAILRLLGVEVGVVAVTKADAADEETLELALAEARELVPGGEAIAVSAKTGAGLDELRAALARAASQVAQSHKVGSAARLHVDRSFSLRGIGTVVTGTLWSGTIGEGDVLRLEPAGIEVRARSVQVHDAPVERAQAGQRVAVALPGIERQQVRRGDALVTPGAFAPSYRLDIALEELEEVGTRVTVHHGTAAVPARVARAGRYAQLRLESPLVAARGDRVVLRRETTVGGGVVLDPRPPRHRDPERFALLERGEIAATVHAPTPLVALSHLVDGPLVDEQLAGVERAGEWVFSRAWLDELRATLAGRLAAADPLDPGIDPPAEPWATDVVPLLGLERRGSKLYAPGSAAALGERSTAAAELEAALAAAAPATVKVDDRELARFLEAAESLVRLGDGHAVARAAYDRARELLLAECGAAGQISLARFRDLVGCGRRDAQLLLERLDADGVTRRVGDARVVRRSASR